jgi:hypothetical protein
MRKITLFLAFTARAITACRHSVLVAAGDVKPSGIRA